jgi:hypothetical protein
MSIVISDLSLGNQALAIGVGDGKYQRQIHLSEKVIG